jgi:FMN phosphatase YigB (HAD superfamily)
VAFEGLFDVALFSHRCGRRKPDPAAYAAAAAALGVAPAQVVFVDDKPRNVQAAAAVGMHGLVFTGPARLAEDLVALGLLAPSDVPLARSGSGADVATPSGSGP